ncbi:hypothetical protein SAMN05443287_11230 [Micromonospora phaseoli]|uniref:CBM2 domain-containing protein n=1 Tax=Micromonospora phaseoli TaxID=1144548 RepID=A0A1H7D682_9ACTN|nr:hypothetical protein [Micromonospora phaseoli]PZV90809.1 hypothetical protein CLV64_11231 [Micromonospora phaseoli]SEJ97318.1 hypothetical protein SAMN05443287_11230 [Micromonospora phaseoli]
MAGATSGGRTLPRMIASAPWVVVLVGTAVLAVLLVVAALSFRGPERPAAWAPGPPMVLPAPAATTGESTETGSRTTAPVAPPASVSPSISDSSSGSSAQQVDPSPVESAPVRSDGTRSPSAPAPTQSSPAADTGVVSASYRLQDSDAGSFEAQLVVRNGTGRSSDWQVELRFNSGVSGIRASSGPGVSVTIKGGGWYLLSGTGQLGAGAQQSVYLRFTRTGGGEYPALCTVNAAACGTG